MDGYYIQGCLKMSPKANANTTANDYNGLPTVPEVDIFSLEWYLDNSDMDCHEIGYDIHNLQRMNLNANANLPVTPEVLFKTTTGSKFSLIQWNI